MSSDPSQLPLFAETTPDADYTPPAHIQPHQHGTTTGYNWGCRCTRCVTFMREYNQAIRRGQRICKHCGTHYPRTFGGGTKFCATCIADGVYQRFTQPVGPRPLTTCDRCATQYKPTGTARRWNLCTQCTRQPAFRIMMGALARHNAPVELILDVIDWPYCANEQCGNWLLTRSHHKRGDGHTGYRYVYNYAIDHDHTCCPGERSCGNCIRGIVCRDCNGAMPHTLDPIRAQGILDYLTRRP